MQPAISLLLPALLFPGAAGSLAASQQVTLDFDSPAMSGYRYCLEEGFHVESPQRITARIQSGAFAHNGTPVIPVLSNNPPVVISHMDGARFTPVRVDIAEYSIYAKPANNQVPILREVSSNPDGPWLPDGSFTPGSISRTVPLHSNGQARRFLRLRYPE